MVEDPAGALRPARRRVQAWLDRLPPTPTRVVRRLRDRQVLLAGSSLAFYGLISALPLLLISLAVAQRLLGPDTVRQLGETASATQARGAGRILTDLTGAASAPGWWIYVLALWPATAYGGGLRRAFVEANRDQEALPGLKGRGIGLLLVLVLPVLLVAGIPLTFSLTHMGGGLLPTLGGLALGLGGGVVAGTLLNTLLYRVFTSEHFGWRVTVGTAVVVATLTSLLSLGFVAYVRLATLEQRYGSGVLAMVMLFGVWLLAANVLLLAGYHALVELEETDGRAGGQRGTG